MIKTVSAILQVIFVFTVSAQQNILITVDSLPPEPRGYDLFIAGSFNKWNPSDESFRFQRKGNGQFYIELQLPAGNYEYKITRGSWKEVECSAGGKDIANRVLKVRSDESLVVNIAGWRDQFPEKPGDHTACSHVRIMDTAFRMPGLKRSRRVWIYLPEEYYNTKLNLRFPVLYLHDGQNIFDNATSFAGEWGVDECIDSMKKKCIVVAIDHGAGKRMNEYSPYDFSPGDPVVSKTDSLLKGEGGYYVDFIARTLKPFIDKNYRTWKDRDNTFIAGSSMGGLISLYAILHYPKVFGAAGIFSPSLRVSSKIFDDIHSRGKNVKGRIYFYAGKQEGESMVRDMLKAFEGMTIVSKSKMLSVIRDEGQHHEMSWRKEFPLFYKWMIPQNP